MASPIARGDSVVPPRLTIVIPMEDHRGILLDAIQSWHKQQPFGRDCEVLIVSNGAEPALDREVREALRPSDQLLVVPGANIAACYNAGADAARGDLLLLTEAHCVAQPGCAENLIQFFDAQPVDAACVHSDCFPGPRFAVTEQTLFNQAFVERSSAEGWNKVTIRGFAIRRDAFRRQGGFEPSYELFSQLDLGIRLHAAGVPMGYAHTASVRHCNTDKPRDLLNNLCNFGRGEILYRATRPDDLVRRYLGPCSEWDRRETFRAEAARATCAALVRSAAGSLGKRQFAAAARKVSAAVKLAPHGVLGPVWLSIKSWLELCVARLQRRLTPGSGDRYTRAYARYWGKALRYARHAATAQWLRENSPDVVEGGLSSPEVWRGSGLLPVERRQGRTFRWTESTAVIVVSPPVDAREIVLTTNRLGTADADRCELYANGRRLELLSADDGELRFRLSPKLASEWTLWLTLVCQPWATIIDNAGVRRELGLPLEEIRLQRAAKHATKRWVG